MAEKESSSASDVSECDTGNLITLDELLGDESLTLDNISSPESMSVTSESVARDEVQSTTNQVDFCFTSRDIRMTDPQSGVVSNLGLPHPPMEQGKVRPIARGRGRARGRAWGLATVNIGRSNSDCRDDCPQVGHQRPPQKRSILWREGGMRCPIPDCHAVEWFTSAANYARHFREVHQSVANYFECPLQPDHYRAK